MKALLTLKHDHVVDRHLLSVYVIALFAVLFATLSI